MEDAQNIQVADPVASVVRVCAEKCPTCILRPGNVAGLRPGRVRQLVHDTAAANGHVVCHETIGSPAPAICAGYAAHPLGAARSLALRAVRAGIATLQLVPVLGRAPLQACPDTDRSPNDGRREGPFAPGDMTTGGNEE